MITNLKCKNTIISIHYHTSDNITYTQATQNYGKPPPRRTGSKGDLNYF